MRLVRIIRCPGPDILTGSCLAVLLMLPVFLSGCAALMPPSAPQISSEALPFLEAARGRNTGLSGLKGLGKIRISARGAVADAAWIVSLPGKVRLAVLSAAGQPLQTLAADGSRLISVDHREGERKSWPVSDPELDDILRIPIHLSDLVLLLAGQLPVANFSSASLLKSDLPGTGLYPDAFHDTDVFHGDNHDDDQGDSHRNNRGSGDLESDPDLRSPPATGRRILVLKNRDGRVAQKIFFQNDRIIRVDRMKSDGRFAWRALFRPPISIGGYEFPSFRLESSEARLEVEIRRCIPDPDIAPDAFTPEDL